MIQDVKWLNIEIEWFCRQIEDETRPSRVKPILSIEVRYHSDEFSLLSHRLSKYLSQLKSTCSQSTSSSLSHRRLQIKSIPRLSSLISYRSNVCKQKLSKCIARIIESTHDRGNAFVTSCLRSNTYNYLLFFLLIASANRALFCSVSHRIFQILMRRRQKTKNLLVASLQNFAKHFVLIMHFFVLFFFTEFFRF